MGYDWVSHWTAAINRLEKRIEEQEARVLGHIEAGRAAARQEGALLDLLRRRLAVYRERLRISKETHDIVTARERSGARGGFRRRQL